MVRQSINLRTTGRAHENWGQKDTASTAGAHRAGRESCIHLIDLLTVIWVMMCSARMRHAAGKKRSKLTLECKSRLLKFCERTQKTNFSSLYLPRQCVNVYMRSRVFVKAKALKDVFGNTERSRAS